MAGQHFMQHDPEAEDVGPMVDSLAARLLGRHVRRRAEYHAGLGLGRCACDGAGIATEHSHEFGEPEVDDLRVAVVGQHHVGRLQIPVDDAFVVRAREAFGDLDGEVDGSHGRQRSARDHVA